MPKKSVTRSPRNSKICEFPATMYGLKKWHKKMFELLGWMVLAYDRHYDEKVNCYKVSLKRLRDKLKCKIDSVRDEDKRDDLKIMHKDVLKLIKHVDKDFA